MHYFDEATWYAKHQGRPGWAFGEGPLPAGVEVGIIDVAGRGHFLGACLYVVGTTASPVDARIQAYYDGETAWAISVSIREMYETFGMYEGRTPVGGILRFNPAGHEFGMYLTPMGGTFSEGLRVTVKMGAVAADKKCCRAVLFTQEWAR